MAQQVDTPFNRKEDHKDPYTSYGFGQLGSAFSKNDDNAIIPPVGMVIVAIQFLADNTLTFLRAVNTNSSGHGGRDFICTEHAAHWGGVTTATCSGSTGKIVTLDAAQASTKLIRPGQYVQLVPDTSLLNAHAGGQCDVETPPPVYEGPRSPGNLGTGTGVWVEKVNTADIGEIQTSITLSESITPTNGQTLVFLDERHGHGGMDATGVTYPKGIVIYGRWSEVIPATDTAGGGIIAYFGY